MKRTLGIIAAVALASAGAAQAQLIFTDLGATTPTPGTYDVSQLTTGGSGGVGGALNYYDNNSYTSTPGACGSTFTTTSANPGGYIVTNVIINVRGNDSGGNAGGSGPEDWEIELFAISGSSNQNAALIFSGATAGAYTGFSANGWHQYSGMSVPVQANAMYAYTIDNLTGGWDALGYSPTVTYAGGAVCRIPDPSSGSTTVSYFPSDTISGAFDIGLGLPSGLTVGSAAASAAAIYGQSPVSLSCSAAGPGTLTYQWQTNTDTFDGFPSGTWVNVPGATSPGVTVYPDNTDSGLPDQLFYQLVVTDGATTGTSSPVQVNVWPPTAPVDGPPLSGGYNSGANTTPSAIESYIGSTVIFTASFVGTTPITNIWQTDAGNPGTFTNIPGATGNSLTLANVQLTNVGNYRFTGTNILGSATTTAAPLTVASLIYEQTFNQIFHGNQSINNLGWRDDVNSQDTRFFTDNDGLTYPEGAWYSGGTANEDMWVDAAIENGSVTNVDTTGHPNITNGFQPPFPVIPLSGASNIAFTVNGISTYNPQDTANYFLVQMNGNAWYVSTTEMEPVQQFNPTTYSLTFNAAAANWHMIAISPNGSVGEGTLYPIDLGAATNDLTGNITGSGVLCDHPGGNSDDNFNNFTVLGNVTYSCLPQLNSSPASVTNYTGTTATLSVAATTNSATNFTTAGLTFQWKYGTGPVSSFVNVPNSGQFSGVTSEDLVISNVSAASDDKSFAVVVTDGCGSVTSAPAVLTVVDSAPVVTSQTTITPNSFEINNNVQATLSGAFAGTLPIAYQWIGAPGAVTNTNVVGMVTNITITPVGTVTNVPGATTPTYVFTNPGTNLTGWYSLRASNTISAGTPTTNTWAQLTVLPHTGIFTWAAPVAFAGLTADQILGAPNGQLVSAEYWGNSSNTTVTTSNGKNYLFVNQGGGFTTVYTGPSTGNANMNTVLNDDVENFGTSTYSVTGLTVGRRYGLQCFGVNDTGGSTRPAYWSDPNDANDISRQFEMGDNVYTVGTFIATNTTQSVTENEPIGGYISSLVLRAVQPTLTITPSGANVILNVDFGTTLISAPTLNGPWTTNTGVTFPHTVPATGTEFFQVQAP